MGTKNIYNNQTYAKGAQQWTLKTSDTQNKALLTSVSASLAKFNFSTTGDKSLFVSSST